MKSKTIAKLIALIMIVGIISCIEIFPVNAEYFNGQTGYASINSSGTSNSYLIIGTADTSSYQSISMGYPVSITNSPISLNFGVIKPASTYYAYNQSTATGYSNPVTAGQCYFTITNTGSSSVNLAMSCTNATGGNTWTLVGTSPTGDQFEVIAVYQGENPASGLVLTNSNVSFYTGLAASGTLKWDFEWITGGTAGAFSDGVGKSFSITITGS
jgi:hypothetical protein